MADPPSKDEAPTGNRPPNSRKPPPRPRTIKPLAPSKSLPPTMRSLMSSFNPGVNGVARFSLIKGDAAPESTAHPPPPPPMEALQGTLSFGSGHMHTAQARRPKSRNHSTTRDSLGNETEASSAQASKSTKRSPDGSSAATQGKAKRAKIAATATEGAKAKGKASKNKLPLQLVKDLPNEIGDMILLHAGPVKLAQLIRDDKHYAETYGWGKPEAAIIWRRTFQMCNTPPPMPWKGMTHEKLAWLIFAKGCSEPECRRDRTETVMWEFGLRLCKPHQQLRTRNVHDLDPNIKPNQTENFVPRHTLGGSRSGVVVENERVAAISQEFKDLVATTGADIYAYPPHAAISAWIAKKRQDNDQFMHQVALFKTWLTIQNFQAPDYRELRREVLQKLALQEDPVFTLDVLMAIPAFVSVVSDKRELKRPVQALRQLMPKLEAGKDRALEMLERNGLPLNVQEQREKVLYEQARMETNQVWEWLRRFSLDVFNRLGPLPAQDLVLRTLDEIRSTYYELREELRPDGTPITVEMIRSSDSALRDCLKQRASDNPMTADEIHSTYLGFLNCHRLVEQPHILNIGDAYRIYKDVLAPSVPDDEIKATLESFKCAGCKRRVPQETPRWGFGVVLRHIQQAHKGHIDLFEYYGINHLPLWVEWPPTLPVLAEHHSASPTGECDLQTRHPYQLRPHCGSNNEDSEYLFKGRWPANPPDIEGDDFKQNLLFALRGLETAGLQGNEDSPFCAVIALEFAILRFENMTDELPPYESMRALLPDPEFIALSGMFGNNKCGQCVEEEKATGKSGNKHSFEWLVRHWAVKHAKDPDLHWTCRMFKLPSHEDLAARLRKPKSEKANQAFEALFPPLGSRIVKVNNGARNLDGSARLDDAAGNDAGTAGNAGSTGNGDAAGGQQASGA